MNTLYQNAHSPELVTVNAFKFADVPLVVIGAIVAVALGAPALGVTLGAIAWILQRILQVTDRRFIRKLHDPVKQTGATVTESFGRIWLLAGAIVISGVAGSRKDGLAAAILIFAAYSVAFAIRLVSGPPPERKFDDVRHDS